MTFFRHLWSCISDVIVTEQRRTRRKWCASVDARRPHIPIAPIRRRSPLIYVHCPWRRLRTTETNDLIFMRPWAQTLAVVRTAEWLAWLGTINFTLRPHPVQNDTRWYQGRSHVLMVVVFSIYLSYIQACCASRRSQDMLWLELPLFPKMRNRPRPVTTILVLWSLQSVHPLFCSPTVHPPSKVPLNPPWRES